MNQSPGNYQQGYYQNATENYDDYYENEIGEYKGNCGDAPSLRVPDARLYAEGFQDMLQAYSRNSPFYGKPLVTEIPTGPCRHPTTTAVPIEYYPDDPQTHYFSPPAPKHRIPPTQTPSANAYHMRHCNQYSVYANEIPLVQGTPYRHETNDGMQGTFEDANPDKYVDNILRSYANRHSKAKTCALHENCADYTMGPIDENLRGPDYTKDAYADYRKRKFFGYGNKMSRGAAIKKYPITVKTPKYTTKNFMPNTLGKRPSALCLPVVTQPDPSLVKRKSKTNQQIRKTPIPSEQFSGNMFDPNLTFSVDEMHAQGDVKTRLSPEGFETFLDQYENNLVLNEGDDYVELQNKEDKNDTKIKDFAKFLRPRVPSSVKFKQEKPPNIRAGRPLQPKLKLSLDKLLNRLQKCEKNDETEQLSDRSCNSENKDKKPTDNQEINDHKINSFNYDVLSRKCSPNGEKGGEQDMNDAPKQALNSMFGSESKASSRQIRSMDDHCALDLHRSKSYIVDLIDRALSKELGTVPRDQPVHHNLTTNKAVATISRHRHSNQGYPKELCYEVTAALTDSIISNATAPPKRDVNQIVERCTSDGQIQRTCEDTYIKQLKQLRWGHIRHIQHEARKLADLEEFLEKCGEIEY